jgi:predicted XRE-type DNA-binding protein
MPNQPDLEALREYLDANSAPAANGCRLWTAGKYTGRNGEPGYGAPIKAMRAIWHENYSHRLAWIAANGPIPAGMLVLHKCDTPSCVNAEHHFLGDYAANAADMAAKGRVAHGSRSGRAKLNAEEVREIVALLSAGGMTQEQIGQLFGVTQATVSRIACRQNWLRVIATAEVQP